MPLLFARSLKPGGGDVEAVLRAFAVELPRLLLGERAIIINRGAISEFPNDPTFARILASRGSVFLKLGLYLEGQQALGHFRFQKAGDAAELFVGLVVGDQQVRRLLGSISEPGPRQVEARAGRTVKTFLKLFGTG